VRFRAAAGKPAELLGKWRAGLRSRRSGRARRSLTMQWLTGVLFAVATALLSAALALLPAAIDNALRDGWGGADQAVWSASAVFFAVAGLALLGWAAWQWHERGVILSERGTAYLVEEHATVWWREEKATVLAAIGRDSPACCAFPGRRHWMRTGAGGPTRSARRSRMPGPTSMCTRSGRSATTTTKSPAMHCSPGRRGPSRWRSARGRPRAAAASC